MSQRVPVRVLVECREDGKMVPMQITWPDGRVFAVDRLLDVRKAPAKSGGAGVRFLCRIQGREVPLYFGLDNSGTREIWWCDGKE